LALITPTGIYYYHTDHLGTPQLLTDSTQAVVWQAHYDPFGRATVVTQTVVNNLRLPGQYYDQEMGLHYNYFRDYDPTLGRYIQSDPIGLAGGINTYAYVGGNPVNNIDPDGLTAVPIPLPEPLILPRLIPYPLDPIMPLPMPNEDGSAKKCKRIGIKTDKWPGVPKGYKQCIYSCKTDAGIHIITRFVSFFIRRCRCPRQETFVKLLCSA
jgi:RHS repeat-associated protein